MVGTSAVGQHVGEPILREDRPPHLLEDVARVGPQLDAAEGARAKECIEDRGPPGARIRAGEEPVPAPMRSFA